jgi:hypothetical protein
MQIVKFIVPYCSYAVGEKAGFSIDEADRLKKKGIVEFIGKPEK